MIRELTEILQEYIQSLDREYDNDMVLLAEKIMRNLEQVSYDVNILKSAIPTEVPKEIVYKIKDF